MVNLRKSRSALMAGILLLSAGNSIQAQTVQPAISADSLRTLIAKAVTQKLQKSHYSPKTINDQFSGLVWDHFIKDMDPFRNVFLSSDIASLKKYRLLLDDEINSNNVAFFYAAWKIYSTRIKEDKAFTQKLLKQPLNYSVKTLLKTDRKDSPYPTNKSAKEKLWKEFLTHYVLKNYAEMETAGSTAGIDPVLEKKAREKVALWYRRYFSKLEKEQAINDKFTVYMNAITLTMDPHSNYIFPQQVDQLMASLRNEYSGVGMELAESGMEIFVKRMVPAGSAYKSGLLKDNDRILAVADNNGKMISTADLDATDISMLIRGKEGTSVTMLVKQPGEAERTVTIPRAKVSDNASKAKSAVINHNGKKLGYLYLPLFYMNGSDDRLPGCSQDVRMEIEKLKDQQVDGIVFDLRGNGGGSLQEVVRMGASFLPASAMSLLRSRANVETYTSPEVKVPQYEGPLVVLVDESSASASEIFAGAIQDYRRGVIIGTTSTFGKGTSQAAQGLGKMGDPEKGTADISYGSIRITLQKFYRATGTTTQLVGVRPDVVLADRAVLNSIRENDYADALIADTIEANKISTWKNGVDYAAVISKAQQRAKTNSSLQLFDKNMKSLKQMQQAPVPLDIVNYRILKQQLRDTEKQINLGKELQQSTLELSRALYTRYSPDSQKLDEYQEELHNTWLGKLSKDLFLSEAVLLMHDMIDATGKK